MLRVYYVSENAMKTFLNGQGTGTRYTYRCNLTKFLDWANMSADELLAFKRADKLYALEAKCLTYRASNAHDVINAVRSFCDFYRTPLQFSQSEKRRLNAKRMRKTQDYMFTNNDLKRMALVGDTVEAYVVCVGKSFGLRASDFIRYTDSAFSNLEGKAPVYMGELQTTKEGVLAFPFLDADGLWAVKNFLSSPHANGRVVNMRKDDLSIVLQDLCVRAGIVTDKHVRFQGLRKWAIDRLSMVMSESKWKQIVGKTISEGAYVSPFELRACYKKAWRLMDCGLHAGNVRTSNINGGTNIQVPVLQKAL